MKQKLKILGSVLIAAFIATGFYLGGLHGGQTGNGFEIVKQAEAAGGKVTSPTGTAPDRYVYYPGTEELKKDEIRLIACGLACRLPGVTRLPPVSWPKSAMETSSFSISVPAPWSMWQPS